MLMTSTASTVIRSIRCRNDLPRRSSHPVSHLDHYYTTCCNGVRGHPMRCKPEKPALDVRPLLTPEQAAGLMGVFKILANDTRLRLLHALVRAGELSVGDLAAAVAMKPQ